MDNQLSMDDQFLTTINQIIEDNIANEDFSVEELATEVSLSRSMLHRKLIKLTGKSASDHITERRLNHARQLLENDVATVSEIAYRVGFSDPSYFNRVYKKHFNISPGNVRKQVAEKESPQTADLKPKIPVPARLTDLRLSVRILVIILIIIIAGGGGYFLLNVLRSPVTSVAVLPLHNLTGQPENAYFVDGMHDALIGELGQIGSLRVISRTSALRYRDSGMLLPEIAGELGVNTIVEGSVMMSGDSIRVLIQLIDVFPKERHILVNEYHDEMQNVLEIQSAAVKDIAQKIRVRLTDDEEQLLERTHTVDPETYKAYLRGMYYINQGTAESFNTGIKYLIEAIDRDPGDPMAYAGFALGKAIQGHGMVAPRESFRSATAAAEKALIIDKTNNEAHTALALLFLYQYWDWSRAQETFETAISNNPNNAIAHAHYAWYHVLLDDMQKSIHHAKMAVDIDPLSASWLSNLAWLYYHNKEYDKAEFWARKSLELSDNMPSGNLVLGWICIKNNQLREAVDLHERLPDRTPRWKYFRCRTYVLAGERERALSLWNELNEPSGKSWVNPFYLGMMAGILGYTDRAFELLNEACDKNYFPITYIGVFPGVEFIRNDPRYNILLQKMNLPYESRSTLASIQ